MAIIIKRQILILILISFSIPIFGQSKSINFDTLVVEITGKVTVKIANYQTGWLKDIEGFNTILDSLKAKIELIKNDIPKEKNFKLTYKTKTNEIIIESSQDLVIFKFNNNVIKSKINECVIAAPEYDIFIFFDKLDDLLTADIQHCVNLASTHEYVSFGNYAKKTNDGIAWTNTCKCENDSVFFIRERSHYNANKSGVSIKAGAGAGIIKNQLTTDFTFRIGKFQTRKGILKHHIYVSDNMFYMFNQTDNIQINNFLNLGYRFNLSNRLDKYNWIGFEAGYLTNSNGDFFKTPTFRLGTMIELRRNISLFPYIYFDNGFKKVYPGIRIGIDLGI